MEMKRPSAGQIAKGRLEAVVQTIEDRRSYILDKNDEQTARIIKDHVQNLPPWCWVSGSRRFGAASGRKQGNSRWSLLPMANSLSCLPFFLLPIGHRALSICAMGRQTIKKTTHVRTLFGLDLFWMYDFVIFVLPCF
jgi:hypothetical protein